MFEQIIESQRRFFSSGETLGVAFRREQLRKLQKAIKEYTPRIEEAVFKDFGKPAFEAYLSEIAMSLRSVNETIRHVRQWSKPRRVRSCILNFPSKEYILPEPLGVSLIISPWNYPFLLAMDPLIAAIGAGNCVVLKPSELTPSTSDVLREMIEKTFYKEFIAVIQGDADTCGMLLKHRFDHIFFTGSTRVGKLVCQAAAGNLTPVTLELGGKSPCIVTNSADLTVAAKRIVWGKLLNAGQTCVAPDYVLVHKDVKGTFVERLKEAIIWFYGTSIRTNPDFPRIVNDRHFDRLEALLDNTQLAVGGNTDKRALYIAPTLIDSVNWDDPVMQEEIFGPLLPILTYETLDEAVTKINEREKPLALYLFTSDKREIRKIETRCHFGGGCINDTISHLLNPYLPFGGVGFSGTGSYHGKYGFDAFSHYKGMVNRKTWPDLPLRYAPYGGKGRLAFLRRFFG